MKTKKSFSKIVVCLVVSGLSHSVVADDRNLIVLRPHEKNMMLKDMRSYLQGIQGINQSLAMQDYKAIEDLARKRGKIAIYKYKPVMPNNLVPHFRRMAVSIHHDFETLANMAKNKKKPLEIIGHMGEMMQTCVSCHETFRIGDYAHDST